MVYSLDQWNNEASWTPTDSLNSRLYFFVANRSSFAGPAHDDMELFTSFFRENEMHLVDFVVAELSAAH